MASKQLLCFILVFSFILINGAYSGKGRSILSVPRILMPHRSSQVVQYKLYVREGPTGEAGHGCFMWKSSRPDIVSVQATSEDGRPAGCSSSAVVVVESSLAMRQTAIVTAEDIVAGVELKTDVIVDVVKRFEVVTTTRELYLDDSPEEFVIKAINDYGDQFTTLEGLTFQCKIINDKSSTSDVVRVLKFSHSTYDAPSYIKRLEDQGQHGDRVLLQGMNTGSAEVLITPTDPLYKDLKIESVHIAVIANLQLHPSIVYVALHGTVKYRVDLIRHGRANVVEMPHKEYRLSVENEGIGSLDVASSTLTAQSLGSTTITLYGQRTSSVKLSEAFREPSAAVHVVSPAYVGVTVVGSPNLVLVTGRVYEVLVNAYDIDNHLIHPSENLKAKAEFIKEYFTVLLSSVNGTYYTVRAEKSGNTDIHAQLISISSKHSIDVSLQDFEDVVGVARVAIVDPVLIQPSTLILPLNIHTSALQYQFNITGGSGSYIWSSSNDKLGTVNSRGVLSSVAKTTASFTVRADDERFTDFYSSSKVLVLPPSRIELVKGIVEAEIGSQLRIPLNVYAIAEDGLEHRLTVCQEMNFAIRLADKTFINAHVEENVGGHGCGDVVLFANTPGQVVLTVEYQTSTGKLSAHMSVAAFLPLKYVDVDKEGDGEVVLVEGSSMDVRFEGGPRPWNSQLNSYIQTVTYEVKHLITVTPVEYTKDGRDGHVVRVTCHEKGEQMLKLLVGNEKSENNIYPQTRTAEVRVTCGEVGGLEISPRLVFPTRDGYPPCPLASILSTTMPRSVVVSKKSVTFVAILTDKHGRRFDNFSSLIIDWSISNESVGSISTIDDSTNRNRLLAHREIAVKLNGLLGELELTATLDRFDSEYFSQWSVDHVVESRLKRSVKLNVVNYPTFNPDKSLTLYNTDKNEARLEVVGGSNHFYVFNTSQDKSTPVVSLTHHPTNHRLISVRALQEGSMTLSVVDLCLDPHHSNNISITVSDVDTITANCVDKVVLGGEAQCYVKVLDARGSAMLNSFFPLMKLKPMLNSDIISISSPNSSDDYTWQYTIKGERLGKIDLRFTGLTSQQKPIHSALLTVQVFQGLVLEPKNVVLVVGSTLQVTSKGGPYGGTSLLYSSLDTRIASIGQHDGLIFALKVGTTTVIGRCVGVDEDLEYSSDVINVKVVELSGIKIAAPIKLLLTGTMMPLYATGKGDDVTPFSFAGLNPSLTFHWSVSNKDVASVENVYKQSGLSLLDSANVAMRLRARSEGEVVVSLNVTWLEPENKGRSVYQQLRMNMFDSINIRVKKRLRLGDEPEGYCRPMLVTPLAKTTLTTNMDGSVNDVVSYKMTSGGEVVTVSDTGVVESGTKLGRAVIEASAVSKIDAFNQTAECSIRVKPLQYVMITPVTRYVTKVSRSLNTLPSRSHIDYVISFHDDVGEKFHATSYSFNLRPHRYEIDIKHISPNTFTVSLSSHASLVTLKASDPQKPDIVDYIRVPVGHVVEPSDSPVVLGSVVCLNSPLLTSNGERGVWYDGSGLLNLSPHSGILVTDVIGTLLLSYNTSSQYSIGSELTVVPITAVTLEKTEQVGYLSNNGDKESMLNIEVTLKNHEQRLTAQYTGKNCSEKVIEEGVRITRFPYTCQVKQVTRQEHIPNLDSLITVQPAFSHKRGVYSCIVKVNSSEEHISELSRADAELAFTVSVTHQGGGVELVSAPLPIPFNPVFHLRTPKIWIRNDKRGEIVLTCARSLQGNIQVLAEDESLISVGPLPLARRSTDSDTVVRFQVSLISGQTISRMSVITVSTTIPAYSQQVSVHINQDWADDASPAAGSEEVWFFQTTSFMIFIAVAFFTICTIGACYKIAQSPPGPPGTYFVSPSRSPGFVVPGGQYPASPPQGQGLWSADRSPYTPPHSAFAGSDLRNRANNVNAGTPLFSR